MLYFNTCWLTISWTEGLIIAPVIPMKGDPSPNKCCLLYMLGVDANLICLNCKFDAASNFQQNVARSCSIKQLVRYCKLLQGWLQLMCPTLCSMLEIIAKFDDVGNCIYMFEMFYPLVL